MLTLTAGTPTGKWRRGALGRQNRTERTAHDRNPSAEDSSAGEYRTGGPGALYTRAGENQR
jgi:hypothetical protein